MIVIARPSPAVATVFAAALLLAPAAGRVSAQTGTSPIVAVAHDIGAGRSQKKPYSFAGRILDLDALIQGSGALIRRHTVLTAAHVVYDPATGFGTSVTFERALYVDRRANVNLRLSTQRATAVATLSGYQEAAPTGVTTATQSRDLGYLVITAAPVDEDFATYARQPSPLFRDNSLTDPAVGRFVVGYPAETFSGSIMAYIVPTLPYVEAAPGNYNNFNYLSEGGMSGGPVFAVINGVQTIVGETTYGTTGSFDDGTLAISGIRAIDKEADRFLTAAEYNNGLIAGTTITPANTALYPVDLLKNQITVNRGDVVTFNTRVVFTTPARGGTGGVASTTRYPELTLTSNLETNTTPGANPTPLVAIKKTANNQFQVTFNAANRTGTSVDLQVQYNKKVNAPSTTTAANPGTGAISPTINAPSTLRVVLR